MSAKVVKGSRTHRLIQVGAYGGCAVAVLLVAMTQPDFRMIQLTQAATLAMAMVGLNMLTGYTGLASLGHSAFVGVGAYTAAILIADHGWPLLATIPVSIVFGIVLGALLGLPAIRTHGMYLGLVTFAVAAVFPVIIKSEALSDRTGGANGKRVDVAWVKPDWFPFDVTDRAWRFLVAATGCAVACLVASNIIRSRVGRTLISIRDNPTAAAVSGMQLARWKTSVFAASAAFAAAGGALGSIAGTGVAPDSYGFLLAVQLLLGIVLGGIGTVSGAIIGGLAVVFLPYYTSEWASGKSFLFVDPADSGLMANVVYGLLLISCVYVAPGGAVSLLRSVRKRLFVVVPATPELRDAGRPATGAAQDLPPQPQVSTTVKETIP